MAKIEIFTIWAIDRSDRERVVWIEDAWDEYAIDNNQSGWDEALKKASSNGGAEIRVIRSFMDYDKVKSSFEPTWVNMETSEEATK